MELTMVVTSATGTAVHKFRFDDRPSSTQYLADLVTAVTHASEDKLGVTEEEQTVFTHGYYDLAEILRTVSTYSDFEGFANPDEVLAIVDDPAIVEILDALTPEEQAHTPRELIRDLLIHWVFENIDQAEPPTIDQTLEAVATIAWLISCRFWMKADQKEVEDGDRAG